MTQILEEDTGLTQDRSKCYYMYQVSQSETFLKDQNNIIRARNETLIRTQWDETQAIEREKRRRKSLILVRMVLAELKMAKAGGQ